MSRVQRLWESMTRRLKFSSALTVSNFPWVPTLTYNPNFWLSPLGQPQTTQLPWPIYITTNYPDFNSNNYNSLQEFWWTSHLSVLLLLSEEVREKRMNTHFLISLKHTGLSLCCAHIRFVTEQIQRHVRHSQNTPSHRKFRWEEDIFASLSPCKSVDVPLQEFQWQPSEGCFVCWSRLHCL